ncbi:MAG TPA: S8 family peptidase [Povalibacter sp.]|uniref:S8 family peptidase n=1 Tax=Povalibacter sp. TaxID=1962978 RepID=UPI002C49AE8B|nr:S8 family peptidase [Povalibacter sp.]HMN43951.1 S8 family peptidase [Povalibacter sp.]
MRSELKFAATLLLLAGALTALGAEYNGEFAKPGDSDSADSIIVRWRASETGGIRLQKAARLSGLQIHRKQSLDTDTDVLELPHRLSGNDLSTVLRQIEADPEVVYASPDLRRHAHALTNDPLLASQWYLLAEQPSATRTDAAWGITSGDPSLVVAVLDTGVRFDHPDLGRTQEGGKLLPGYDFVSRLNVANDGNARDADPSDPGDWVDSTDRTQADFSDCDIVNSSWHGTRVAGLVGALTNNAAGVAGAAFNTRILPVRVLGKCGGFDSDIIAAMRWAAGLSVAGVPANPTPAAVINLSLGSDGLCTAAYQAAVDEITARGVLVVASAGNEGGPVGTPANCSGVLGVAGIRHAGTKVGFSNLGPALSIGAPGGNCVNTGIGQPCLFSIVVASNSGTTIPAMSTYTDQIRYNVGTSFSAPQAAAAVALMRAVNSRLSPGQLVTLVRQSASPFPVSADTTIPTCHAPVGDTDLQATECNCTTQTCGAGMLNTGAAVAAARRPFAILQTAGTAAPGATIALDAGTSFASNGRTLVSYRWSAESVNGSVLPVIAAPAQASTSLQMPNSGRFTLRLTIADDQGEQDTEAVMLAVPDPPATPTPTPPATSGGGGGGGETGWELIAFLALLLFRTRQSIDETDQVLVEFRAERLVLQSVLDRRL